ncbi:MAG: TlpA disulfide reductase family protein [Candidatus Krumholzibacteria bacterium]
MNRLICRLAILLTVLTLGFGPVRAGGIEMGHWRAVLSVPGGDLTFGIELLDENGRPAAYYLNGAERVRVDEVTIRGDSLTLGIPSFDSKIRAVLKDGRLVGTLRLVKRGGVHQVIPFSAERGGRISPEHGAAAADFGGRWSVTFVNDNDAASKAVAEFRQEGARLFGTFRTLTGDYRYLEGRVHGDKMYLSCFDGGHAFLFKAALRSDGDLEGEFWSGTKWHERWVAMRDEEAALPDPLKLTYLKPGYDAFTFQFPDLGGRPVSLSDERFRGKVVIVTLAGSWCPNCHDEAAFLAPFYTGNKDRGLEVIALMFEHFKDFETAVTQVNHFRERHGIEYMTLIAGYSNKSDAAETLPMLNHVLAYPTTIFIDRRGEVRRIRTGFDGPATGERFTNYTEEMVRFVGHLLDE